MGKWPAFDILARVPLLPVLLWQAIQVRRVALVLPEADGPREGISGQGAPLRLLIVGDSSAAGVGVQHQSQALLGQTVQALAPHRRVSWRLIAKTGATTQSTLTTLRADQQMGEHSDFDVAVLVLGVNDAVRLLPARLWRDRHAKLRAMMQEIYGARFVIAAGVPPLADFPALPSPLRWILGAHGSRLDSALKQDLANDAQASHLAFDLPVTATSMAADGYHPNAESYAYCGKAIAAEVLLRINT